VWHSCPSRAGLSARQVPEEVASRFARPVSGTTNGVAQEVTMKLYARSRSLYLY
jgi:hypothetical protein